jgi:hypothetical protein
MPDEIELAEVSSILNFSDKSLRRVYCEPVTVISISINVSKPIDYVAEYYTTAGSDNR